MNREALNRPFFGMGSVSALFVNRLERDGFFVSFKLADGDGPQFIDRCVR
jgi:hypothetical protein